MKQRNLCRLFPFTASSSVDPMVNEVKEIDTEYEFDAAQWYDFARMELRAESEAAELWFHSAPSYAPSREFPHRYSF